MLWAKPFPVALREGKSAKKKIVENAKKAE
jgi:hypothetical protein